MAPPARFPIRFTGASRAMGLLGLDPRDVPRRARRGPAARAHGLGVRAARAARPRARRPSPTTIASRGWGAHWLARHLARERVVVGHRAPRARPARTRARTMRFHVEVRVLRVAVEDPDGLLDAVAAHGRGLRFGVTSIRRHARAFVGELARLGVGVVRRAAAIRSGSARARRFRSFGDGSAICFPIAALYGEEYIEIGDGCIIGPVLHAVGRRDARPRHSTTSPACSIGDRVPPRARAAGSSATTSIEIGDDVFTGHHVYITDANHGYEDVTLPIGRQFARVAPGACRRRLVARSRRGRAAGRRHRPPRRRSARDRWSPAHLPDSQRRGRQPGARHPPLRRRRGLGA